MGPPLRLGGDGEEVEGAEEAELEEAVKEAPNLLEPLALTLALAPNPNPHPNPNP